MRNIGAYISGLSYLLVWDNTPAQDADSGLRRQIETAFGHKIVFVSAGKNNGISLVLNRAVCMANEKGCSHLLTMDQDSYWENFGFYIDAIERLNCEAIFCPNYNTISCTADTRIDYGMQSGSVYPLRLFDEIGCFKENYFIDAIDTEFCIRAQQYGIPTVRVGNALLQHSLGNPIKRFGFVSSNYSPFRTYHIVRNHVSMWREYGNKLPYELRKMILMIYIVVRGVKILAFEREKWPKLRAIGRGVVHGLKSIWIDEI